MTDKQALEYVKLVVLSELKDKKKVQTLINFFLDKGIKENENERTKSNTLF